MNRIGLLLAVLALLSGTSIAGLSAPESAEGGGPFRVVRTLHVGGEGGWDYIAVDSVHSHLYVPRTTHTLVLDAKTGKAIGDIPGQKHNHGVVLVPDAGRGFISDGEGFVVVFDLKSNQVLGKIKAAEDADAIIYDSASRKVLVVCGDANSVIPVSPGVDLNSGHADAPIELGGKPEGLASDDRGKVYINLVDKNQVAVVNTITMRVENKWSTAPGGSPVGMSMDRQHRRLFVGCRNPQKLIVLSADDGRVLADMPIGIGCDGTKFDDGYVFASCRDGSLAVARETSPNTFSLIQTVITRPGAKTLGVDHTTHTVYLPTAELSDKLDARKRPIPTPGTFKIVVVAPVAR